MFDPLPLRFDRSSFYICPTDPQRVDLVNRTFQTTFRATRIDSNLVMQASNDMSVS